MHPLPTLWLLVSSFALALPAVAQTDAVLTRPARATAVAGPVAMRHVGARPRPVVTVRATPRAAAFGRTHTVRSLPVHFRHGS